MADTIEKIYCDRDSNDALYALLSQKNQTDPMAMAAALNGGANQDNTQKIMDLLNVHWQQDLQQRYNDARLELSQQRQNAALIAALKTTTTTTASA